MDIGKNLKALRKESGLTQKELAERLKIGQATIACYENGQREPNITSLIAYADYFECALDFIVGRADDFGNVVIKAENTKRGLGTLNNEEAAFIQKFRELNDDEKNKVNGYIDGLKSK